MFLTQASSTPIPTVTPFINPTTFPASRFGNINTLLGILIPILYIVAGFLFGGMLIYSAFTIITAGGEAEKITKAQQTATMAVIGIIIVILASLIVKLLGLVTNIQILF